jgi:PPOX class probable FMN-dependent enzyme
MAGRPTKLKFLPSQLPSYDPPSDRLSIYELWASLQGEHASNEEQLTMGQHEITSVEQLRGVIGEEVPGLAEKNIDHLNDYALEFLSKSPFLVLSTSDAAGQIDASPKGDAPGFVHVVDSKTIVVPDRPGNKLAYGHLNILKNPNVGLLCMIPGTPETLRINGEATLSADPELLAQLAARGKPATLALRVTVKEVFFHCAKAFIRSSLWQPEQWPERHKISFGEMLAKQRQAAEGTAEAIDQMVADDYQNNL